MGTTTPCPWHCTVCCTTPAVSGQHRRVRTLAAAHTSAADSAPAARALPPGSRFSCCVRWASGRLPRAPAAAAGLAIRGDVRSDAAALRHDHFAVPPGTGAMQASHRVATCMPSCNMLYRAALFDMIIAPCHYGTAPPRQTSECCSPRAYFRALAARRRGRCTIWSSGI